LAAGFGSPDSLAISSLSSITQSWVVPREEHDPGTDPGRRHDQGVPASGCHARRLMGTRGRHSGSRSKTTGGVLCVGSSSLCRSPSWCSLVCSSHGVWVPARKRRLRRLGRQSSNSSRARSAVSWPVVSSRSHQRSWNDRKPDLVFLEAATVRIFGSARSKEALVPLQFPWAVAARTALPHSDRTGADVGQHDYWTRHWPPRSGVHDHMLGEGEISRSRGAVLPERRLDGSAGRVASR
jgi:hypothetical protein